jgi:hypothetical protein
MTRCRVICLGVLVTLALAVGATTPSALAQESIMFHQGLSAGNARAGDPHQAQFYLEGSSDHGWCPSLAVGYAGYTSTPFVSPHDTRYFINHCGPGYQYIDHPSGYSGYWRGTAYNWNVSTFDNFDYATFYYGL